MIQEQLDLEIAANQRSKSHCRMERLETALSRRGAQNPPCLHRFGETFDCLAALVLQLEQATNQLARPGGDHDYVWIGKRLQPSRQIRRVADDSLLLRCAFSDKVAYDHQTSRDTHPDPLPRTGMEAREPDRFHDAKSRPNRALGIIFMGARIAEVDQHTVAHVFGHVTVEAGDLFCDAPLIRTDHLTHVFGIKPG
jgi:hypothetical protein